eukprot:4594661-Pyramimonas_sp.AAC.1
MCSSFIVFGSDIQKIGVRLSQRFFCGLFCDPDLALKDYISVVPGGDAENQQAGYRACRFTESDTPDSSVVYPLSPVISGLGVCDTFCATVRPPTTCVPPLIEALAACPPLNGQLT